MGTFYGFYPVITSDEEDDGADITSPSGHQGSLIDNEPSDTPSKQTDSKHHITLHYRVCINENMYLGNFSGALYALGSISSTHLTFAEDKREYDDAQAISTLADASHNEAAALAAAKIDTLLSPTDDETIFEPHRLHEIASTLRKLESHQGVDMHYRDAVIDLLAVRLGAYPKASFMIQATQGFLRKDNQVMFTGDDFNSAFAILGIGFVPQFAIDEEGDVIRTNEDTLAVVVPATTDDESVVHCYIPFQNLRSFIPYQPGDDD